jgi:hypothetical protein
MPAWSTIVRRQRQSDFASTHPIFKTLLGQCSIVGTLL